MNQICLFANTLNPDNDATWLRYHRNLFGMTQSNLVSFLEVVTGENVNPGRIAEIETGQREIPTLWRRCLEQLFEQLQQAPPRVCTWRDYLYVNGRTR